MKLIIGLGNPEPEYDKTRHNVGFMCINEYVKRCGFSYSDKFNAKISENFIDGEKVIFIKPYTFMNKSGQVVKKFVDFYDVDIKDVMVIYDDLAIDFGNVKLKYSSSHGGHNGMRDIIAQLKTNDIFRVKVGINSEYKKNGRDFVLSVFSKSEQSELPKVYDKTCDIIEMFLGGCSAENIMNKHN